MLRIETRDGGPAINVKHYGYLKGAGSEDERQHAYELACEQFWREAEHEAHRLGFDGLFAAGRSGGWAQPFWQRGGPFGGFSGASWRGRGGDMGQPRYPSMDIYAEQRKVEALARRLERVMARAVVAFGVYLEDIVARNAAGLP